MGKPYETRLKSLRKTYELNVVPQVSDEEFHEEFLASFDELTSLLEEGHEREARSYIKEQMKIVKPYDHCRVMLTTYQSILDSITSRHQSQIAKDNAKDLKLAKKRNDQATTKLEEHVKYQVPTRRS
jgi:hypothetical protein